MSLEFVIPLLITVGIFMAGHLGTAVWLASRLSSEVREVRKDVDRLIGRMDRTDELRERTTRVEGSVAAAHDRIDELTGKSR